MPRWTLENLIDFEQALAAGKPVPGVVKEQVAIAARGLDGKQARRAGLKIWLASARCEPAAGARFQSAMRWLAFGLMVLGVATGAGWVSSLMNHALGGMNVVIFLAAVIGLQWGILAAAAFGWIFRSRTSVGLTAVQKLLGGLLRKLVKEDGWWSRLSDGGSDARAALGWQVAGLAQMFGGFFNIGVIVALGGFVLTRNVGFYWETTTEEAMRGTLGSMVGFLSAPWAWFWPEAVPGAAVIDGTRLLSHATGRLAPGPEAWWLFLLAATFVWGLLPRLVLVYLSGWASRRALAAVDFQGRHHRALWRELTGTVRTEVEEKPLDGVLVLDVGGGGWNRESLRPFLLRKLRVHPAAWHSTAVLDEGEERQAAEAIAMAPAGVVLLAEGWALSPPRMKSLHEKIRALAGGEIPVKFLVANEASGEPVAPAAEEAEQWSRFVDGLRDPNAEVFPFA